MQTMAVRLGIFLCIAAIVILGLMLPPGKWLSDPVRHSLADRLIEFDTYSALTLTRNAEGVFLIKAKDKVIGSTLRSGQVWSAGELGIIRQLTNPGSTAVFIGAHVGTLAIPISRSVNQIIAVEANPETFELLEANIALNHRRNIQAIHVAATEHKGQIDFLLNSQNTGQSKIVPLLKTDEYMRDSPRLTSVPADRIDDLVRVRPTLIHMDIEGSEYFALRGMPRLLSETSYLLIEFFPRHLRNVANITVDQLLSVIAPHFDHLYIPSNKQLVSKQDFHKVLGEMYRQGHDEEVLLFSKQLQPLLTLL